MTVSKANHKDRMVIASMILILLFLPLAVSAQQTTSTISGQTLQHLDPVYGVDQRLVSGPLYNRILPGSVLGNPYFIDEEWKKGSVEFEDAVFENLSLRYDIEVNRIVLQFTSVHGSNMQIALENTAIKSMTIDGRRLVPFPGKIGTDTTLFCEELAGGKLAYLVLRSKEMAVQNGTGYRGYYYKENVSQWLLSDSLLLPFRSKKNIYRLYPEQRQEIRKYLRAEKIYPSRWRMDDREALIRFCNTLLTGSE
jgi:hypothetical protein